MIMIEKERLVIVIEDTSPEERREWIIKAIARHLAHYAMNPEKRKDDMDHALVLADLLNDLVDIKS